MSERMAILLICYNFCISTRILKFDMPLPVIRNCCSNETASVSIQWPKNLQFNSQHKWESPCERSHNLHADLVQLLHLNFEAGIDTPHDSQDLLTG